MVVYKRIKFVFVMKKTRRMHRNYCPDSRRSSKLYLLLINTVLFQYNPTFRRFNCSCLKYLSTTVEYLWTMFSRDNSVRNVAVHAHLCPFAKFVPHVDGHCLFHQLHRRILVLRFEVDFPFFVMDRIERRWREYFEAVTPTRGHVSNLRNRFL